MDAMCGARIAPKHEGTLTRNHLDAAFAAKLYRFGTDRPFSSRTIHPNPAYSGFGAVLNHGLSNLRRGHQESCRCGRLDILHASKAASPQQLWHVGIYWNNVVTASAQFLE